MPNKQKLHIGFALKSRPTREACAAYTLVWSAILFLDRLPASSLEALRDHVAFETEDRQGPLGDLLHAYVAYVNDELRVAQNRERQEALQHGVPGTMWQSGS